MVRALKHSTPAAVLALALGVSVLLGAVAMEAWMGIPVGELTRDPASTHQFPLYVGAVSHLGVLLWCGTTVLCGLCGLLLKTQGAKAIPASFFFYGAGLSGFLMMDDLFQFHDKVFPNYLNVPELGLYISYALAGIGFFVLFWRTLLKTAYPVLLAAGGLLLLSIVADLITNLSADTSIKFLVEDGLKFLGISAWFFYFANTVYHTLQSGLAGPASTSTAQRVSA